MSFVRMDSAAMAEFLRSPQGPVFRHLMVLGDKVKQTTAASLKEGFPRDKLAPTLFKRIEMTESGPRVWVTSNSRYLKPYPIEGKPLLFFVPKDLGHVISVRHVDHPGLAKYLQTKLEAAVESLRGQV